MWLLSTESKKLHYFTTSQDSRIRRDGGYAILSHRWQGHEQTFQDLKAGMTPSSKITRCCELALAHGYKWVWIDSCCIDKTSSAELSEAINSMYNWYAEAKVCYAYLRGVPNCQGAEPDHPKFRGNEWFKRGWTLQELIAPHCVLFLTEDWTPFGTKASLSKLLQDITGVDAEVLTLDRKLVEVSIARRMSWASLRETTRVEDRAYSLLGIFDVHMSPIYGEGKQAFRRLQEEIMQQSSDQSLFAWGRIAQSTEDLRLSDSTMRQLDTHDSHSYLLASSPADFTNCRNIVSAMSVEKAVKDASSVSQSATGKKVPSTREEKSIAAVASTSTKRALGLHVPEFALTSHGVRMHIPVAELPGGSGLTVAVLAACREDKSYIGLLLLPSPGHADTDQFHVAISKTENARTPERFSQPHRLLRIDSGTLSVDGQELALAWRNVYIAHRHFVRSSPIKPGDPMIVHFPPWLLQTLRERGFSPNRPLKKPWLDERVAAAHGSTWTRGWTPEPLTFRHRDTQEAFRILFDQCRNQLWASVEIFRPNGPGNSYAVVPGPLKEGGACDQGVDDAKCQPFHRDNWPGGKAFGESDRRVWLSLSRLLDHDPHDSSDSRLSRADRHRPSPPIAYLADIRLEGHVYAPLSRGQRRSFSSASWPPVLLSHAYKKNPTSQARLASVLPVLRKLGFRARFRPFYIL